MDEAIFDLHADVHMTFSRRNPELRPRLGKTRGKLQPDESWLHIQENRMNKKRIAVCGSLALASCLLGGTLYATRGNVTLSGQYTWKRDEGFWERNENDVTADLKAVFTPAGDHTWDIVFHYDWEDEMRAWKGSATGSLENGPLRGVGVEDRDGKRTFAFRGNVKDGVFTGEHGSERGGGWHRSGTLTLK
jgi:hypothetical protein